MTARVFIFALYLFIFTLTLTVLFFTPTPAHAENWSSDPIPPITTNDVATADFWEACSALSALDATDSDGYVSWFAWADYDHSTQLAAPDSGMYCATVQYAADGLTVISLAIKFYAGHNLDVAFLNAQISADLRHYTDE